MSRILLVFAIGLLLIAIVGGVYYAFVGAGHPISTNGVAWAQFGEYFGGVTGALLSFISILLLVYTVHLQSQQLSDARHELFKQDLLAHVSKADAEIDRWLHRKLATQTDGGTVEFGDVVWGIVQPGYVNPNEFKPAVTRLATLTFLYCEALALYRDNGMDPFFIFKDHKQKAQSLVDFLTKHIGLLGNMAGPSLKFCQMHLDGVHEA